MRFWPGRLRAQLVLLVLATLALAQAVTLWLAFDERALAVRAALGLEAAGRAAALAWLVADAPRAMRPRILAAASSPSARFTIDRMPVADPSADARARALARRVEAALDPWPAGSVRADLHRLRDAPPPMAAMAPRMGRDMERMHRRMAEIQGRRALAELRLSIPLDGGDWLNLVARFRRPAPQWAWPAVLGFALSALALGIVLWLALARITRPLAALAGAADRLGRGEQVAALPETGPEEARRLTAAFNRMQAHLTSMIEERTRLLAALGHDLRSPITALRVRAEMVEEDETRSRMIATLDEMQEMVEAVLAFARGIARSEPEERIELAPFLRELAEDAQAPAPAEVPERLVVTARAGSLRRALRNLIDNAQRYGGGAEVAARPVAGGVEITVADRGPGIPADQLDAVFEPFRRLEGSRSRETGGTGLGLAIARAVAQAHGGSLTLANRAGGGLVATLALPA